MAWYDDLGAGTLGAIDEALFGIPEWIAKQIDRKGVEDYIKKNEGAYRTGEAVGTIGGAFIPFGGLAAKGLKGAATLAKGAKIADVGTDIMKAAGLGGQIAKGADVAADVAKGAAMAGGAGKSAARQALKDYALRGALTGAGEAGVRGFTSEKTPDQTLQDIQSGALFGGLGGAAGGWLSKEAPRLAGELAEKGKQAYLGLTPLKGRQAKAFLKDIAGPGAKGIGKFKASEKGLDELVRVGKEIGAHVPGRMDDAILKHSDTWKKIDNAVEGVTKGATGAQWIQKALDPVVLDEMRQAYGDEIVESLMDQMVKTGSQITGLANVRKFLADVGKASFAESTLRGPKDALLQSAQRDLAKALRSGVDDTVQAIAEKQGLDVDFAKLKKDYLPMRAFAEAEAIGDMTPQRMGLGSPTAEKLAMAGLGTAAGFGTPTSTEDFGERLRNAAIGGTLGFGAKKLLEKGLTGALAGVGVPASNLLAKAAPKLAGSADEMAAFGGSMLGSRIPAAEDKLQAQQTAVDEAAPETPEQADAAAAGAEAGSGDRQAYVSRVVEKLNAQFVASGLPQDEETKRQFITYVGTLTDNFDPRKASAILYPDPEERQKFEKALTVADTLSKNLPQALKWTAGGPAGMLGREFGKSAEDVIAQEASYRSIQGALAEAMKAAAPGVGGQEKLAAKQLDAILASGASQKAKRQMIENTLAGYGVDLDSIRGMGL